MTRILPVRERVLRAVEQALRKINQANGYGTNVKHVRRMRDFTVKSVDPPEIHLVFGAAKSEPRSTEDIWTRIPTFIFFHSRSMMPQDTEYNIFLADIQRCLAAGVVDESAVPLGGPPWEVDVRITHHTDEPLYFSEQEGDIIGLLETEIGYSWCRDDPRKWGLNDKLVMEN